MVKPGEEYSAEFIEDADHKEWWGKPGQGADATWLIVKWHRNGETYKMYEYDDNGEEVEVGSFSYNLGINFDTAYGYNDEYGDCTDLHTRYIVALGRTLEERGLDWWWVNEYTGEVNHKFDGLEEFANHGRSASDWFYNTVIPAFNNRSL